MTHRSQTEASPATHRVARNRGIRARVLAIGAITTASLWIISYLPITGGAEPVSLLGASARDAGSKAEFTRETFQMCMQNAGGFYLATMPGDDRVWAVLVRWGDLSILRTKTWNITSLPNPTTAPIARFGRWGEFLWRSLIRLDRGSRLQADHVTTLPTGALLTNAMICYATAVRIPFWLLLLIILIGPLMRSTRKLVRRLKQTRGWPCSVCGNDLTGNVSGVCPECGEPI